MHPTLEKAFDFFSGATIPGKIYLDHRLLSEEIDKKHEKCGYECSRKYDVARLVMAGYELMTYAGQLIPGIYLAFSDKPENVGANLAAIGACAVIRGITSARINNNLREIRIENSQSDEIIQRRTSKMLPGR